MDQADLLLATLRLASGAHAAELTAAWRSVDDRGLGALVEYERAAQWLLRRLGETGALAMAPRRLTEHLRALARAEAVASMMVDAEAEAILKRLAAWGVPVVLLKGTARRAVAHWYPCADARATTDVDLLLPGDRAEAAWRRLRAVGYEYATDPRATPEGHYHLPPLCTPGSRVAVEFHSSTARTVAPEEAWRRAMDQGMGVDWHGLPVRVPGATELLWHALTHGLTQGPYGFRLRFLLDAAAVLAGPQPVAWNTLTPRLESDEVDSARPARAWLGAAAQLGGFPLPAAVGGGVPPFDLAKALRWRLAVLRRLHDRPRLIERLVESSVRVELGEGIVVPVEFTTSLARGRRRLASAAARFAYRVWRASARAPS